MSDEQKPADGLSEEPKYFQVEVSIDGGYAWFVRKNDYLDLRAKAQALQEQLNNRVVRVRDLIRLLESSASNTDTDWRWQAATALRQCVQWESAEIPLARKR
jgi:hypothetical protein